MTGGDGGGTLSRYWRLAEGGTAVVPRGGLGGPADGSLLAGSDRLRQCGWT